QMRHTECELAQSRQSHSCDVPFSVEIQNEPFAPVTGTACDSQGRCFPKGEIEMYKFKKLLVSFAGIPCNRSIPALLITLAVVMLTCAMSHAAPMLPPGNTVQQWNTISENTVVGSGAFQAEGLVYMGYVSAAVYDAVVSIEGGYETYSSAIPNATGASTDAAVIEAAYRTLVNYFPSQATVLNALYPPALPLVPAGAPKNAGPAWGFSAATDP